MCGSWGKRAWDKRAVLGLVVAVALVCGVAQPAERTAQGQQGQPADGPARISILNTRVSPDGRVTAQVAVTEANGKPWTALKPGDLSIEFGGSSPAGDVNVESLPNLPLRVVLGVDVSLCDPQDSLVTGSISETVQSVRTLLGGDDIVDAFTFSDAISSTLKPPQRGVAGLLTPNIWRGHRTRLYEAIQHAAGYITKEWPAGATPGRTAIVILTNRGDTMPADRLQEERAAIEAATRAHSPVYLLAYGEPRVGCDLFPRSSSAMARIAEATGGAVPISTTRPLLSQPRRVDLLAAKLKAVLSDQRSGYSIEFQSAVPVSTTNASMIGLKADAAVSDTAQSVESLPIAARIDGPATAATLGDAYTLAAPGAWATNVQRVEFYFNGKPVKVVTSPPFALRLDDVRAAIGEISGSVEQRAPISATVVHGLNRVDVTPFTPTIPVTTQFDLVVTRLDQALSGNPISFASSDPISLTVRPRSAPKVEIVSVKYYVGGITTFASATTPITMPRLSPGAYTLTATVTDALGRAVVTGPRQSTVYWVNPALLIALLVLVLPIIIGLLLLALWLNRTAPTPEPIARTRCLVNRGNVGVPHIVDVKFDPQKWRITSMSASLIADPKQEVHAIANPAQPDRLTLVTPSVPPQGRVQIKFEVQPLRPDTVDTDHLTASARPQCQPDDPSKATSLQIDLPVPKRRTQSQSARATQQ